MFKNDNIYYTQIFLICIMSAGLYACQKNNLGSFPDSGENKKVYTDFVAHNSVKVNAVSTEEVLGIQEIVKKLSKKEIENLTEEEVLSIGQPILDLRENTVKVDQSALGEMNRYFEEMKKELDTISQEEHEILSKKIEEAIAESFVREIQYRSFTATEMRNILFKIHDLNTMSFLCEDLFHVSGGNTFLFPGDNLNLANTLCPAGSYFYMTGGIYTGQQVISSKNGNYWVGAGAWQAILDGQQTMNRAFVGAMNNNNFRWFEIKNYTDHGIYSGSGSANNVTIANMIFSNIGSTRNGQEFGAIMLLYATNVLIENSYFENVTSSIRFRFSNGPLQIINNEALNSGRNFFQCGDCNGGGIKINHNSMEYVSSYGTVPLEDWINIFDSAGLSNDPLQVNYNRLKGHASSPTSICICKLPYFSDHLKVESFG